MKALSRFRQQKSTVDQIDLLAQNIEDSFQAKKKAGEVFVVLQRLMTPPAPRLYLQAAETSAGQAHGSDDLGAYPK